MPDAAPRRPLAWLAAGAAAGVAVAAWGLLGTDARSAGLPDSVNGTLLYMDDYRRLVEGVESDTREPASPELRRRVLDRMIEEELLVQRGVELGLVESDRRVRADITQAMIQSIVVETDVHDAGGRHVARVTQTQAVLR